MDSKGQDTGTFHQFSEGNRFFNLENRIIIKNQSSHCITCSVKISTIVQVTCFYKIFLLFVSASEVSLLSGAPDEDLTVETLSE